MNYLGSDFSNTGSVMTKSELTAAREKRGECITCGRRCFRKKLFKLVPLDVHGKVLNGRCLNCKPLQPKDVSTTSLNVSTTSLNSSSHSRLRKSHSGLARNGSNRHIGRRGMYRKSSSRRLQHHPHANTHHHRDHLRKSQSNKEVEANSKQFSPGRTNSSQGSPARSQLYSTKNSSSTRSNRTSSTAFSTRPSISSSALNAAVVSPHDHSSRSMNSSASSAVVSNSPRPPLSTSNNANISQTSSRRSLVTPDSSSKTTEIAWTPPPPLEYDEDATSSSESIPIHKNYQNSSEKHASRRPPSRLNSISSLHSSASKRLQHQPKLPPTREELEQAALTFMAAQQHGLTGPSDFQDIFGELEVSSSQRNLAPDFEKDAEPNVHSPNSHSNDENQNAQEKGRVVQSDIFVPKTFSDSFGQENEHQDHCRPLLNRGGTFEPKHIRPGVGTHVYTGNSCRTMSSMSSIGEEDHILNHFNQLQEQSNPLPTPPPPPPPPQQERPQQQMAGLSRMRSSRTLGSLSSIEVINEEDPDMGMPSSISNGSFSLDRLSLSTPTKARSLLRSSDPNDIINADNAFQEQFVILQACSHSPDQIKSALKALSELERPDTNDQINLCGIEIVVTSMESYADLPDVQHWGCSAISNLSLSFPGSSHALVQAGAASRITEAMKRFIENAEDLQERAITALSNLANNPSNMDYLVSKGDGAVEAIVWAMGHYPGKSKIQTSGCVALTRFASQGDSALRLKIMDEGAGEAILFNSMAMHASDSVVQTSALSAVRNLCTDCEENQQRFLEFGIVDPILSAMQKHRRVPQVQEDGAGIISILAENSNESKIVIAMNGGMRWILRAILDHSNTSRINQQSGMVECCSRAMLALILDSYQESDSSSSKSINKAQMVVGAVVDAMGTITEDTNTPRVPLAISAVIAAMDKDENISVVQEVGCAILGVLTELSGDGLVTNTAQTKMEIVDEGALDAINMAMVLHKREAAVQERACALLLNLAIEENYASILAAIGIEILRDAAEDFPKQCKDSVDKLIELLGSEETNNEE